MTVKRDPHYRRNWAAARARMEAGDEKHTPEGRKRKRIWGPFALALAGFGIVLRASGLYGRGVRNALDVRVNAFDLPVGGLPEAFDGYRLLHLTDLHIDALDNFAGRLAETVSAVECDLCVMTGDYRFRVHGEAEAIRPGMARLMQGLRARDGVFGILGNHDSADMAAIFDSLGVRMLINETATVMRGGEALHVTGVDDVHYYYTGDASDALRFAPDGCRIALVHSPELAEQAADAGVALYLTGHTHGGQVCLPGGLPVFTHSHGQRRFSSGLWRKGGMVGYTSRGAGVSGLPVRFNCPGEATLITLRRA
jgi:predicted MPP superfamily phosphohydrolase